MSERTRSNPLPNARLKVSLAAALAIVPTAILFCLPRFSDPAWVYSFADRRRLLGIPNFLDVISNAPWLVIGLLGLRFVARTRAGGADSPFSEKWERVAFAVLFAGVLLVALGSAWFHLAPAVATLLWDRLPMTIVFMSVFAIVIGERLGMRAGRLLFSPLLALGIASVLYWHYTESLGRGDVRPYVLVQFLPLIALTVLLLLFPARYTRTGDLVAALGWYVLAKLVEYLDGPIFVLTGIVSGHTMKHLCAALTTVWLLRMMKLRRPLAQLP